jgi:hypothetical protein
MDDTMSYCREREILYLVDLEKSGLREFENYIDSVKYLVSVLTGPSHDFPSFDDITETYVIDLLKSSIQKVEKTIAYQGLKK